MPQQQRTEAVLAELQRILDEQKAQSPTERLLSGIEQPVGPVRPPRTSIPTNVQGVEVPVRPEPSVLDSTSARVGQWLGDLLGVYGGAAADPSIFAPAAMVAGPLRIGRRIATRAPEEITAAQNAYHSADPRQLWSGQMSIFDTMAEKPRGMGEGGGSGGGNAFTRAVLYGSEEPGIAERYAISRDYVSAKISPRWPEFQRLTYENPELRALRRLAPSPFDGLASIAQTVSPGTSPRDALKKAAMRYSPEWRKPILEAINKLSDEDIQRAFFLSPEKGAKGSIYELLAHFDPERLAQWEKPVMQQPPGVQRGLFDVLDFLEQHDMTAAPDQPVGPILRELDNIVGPGIDESTSALVGDRLPKNFPEVMTEIGGLHGVEYPAGTLSGRSGSEARNFAIWDPKTIELIRRYPVLAALFGIGAVASHDKKDDE